MGEAHESIRQGLNVYGSDGEKIGEVFEALPGWFVVTKGFVFPTDHYIPLAAVDRIDAEGSVLLAATTDDALEQGWGTDPAGIAQDATAVDPVPGRATVPPE